MKIRKIAIFTSILALSLGLLKSHAQKATVVNADLCIYGGTSAGVIAAYVAHKYGLSSVIYEQSAHIGGMSASGLGSTDIGNKYAITGVARDFYRRMGAEYAMFEQWNLEPSKAEALFQKYMKASKAPCYLNAELVKVLKSGTKITSAEFTYRQGKKTFKHLVNAKIFIDCSYEADLMKEAGVSYTIGRESAKEFNESYNGVQLMKGHQFPDGIDPYVVEGDPKSGLLWGISNETLQPDGTGDKKMQAYNFRLCLTDNTANKIDITPPAGYDPRKFALLSRLINKSKKVWLTDYMIINRMPNAKTDINHRGGFSLDYIGANWNYPEANYQQRKQIAKEHEDYIKGFLYFMGNDASVPDTLKKQMKRFGWPKDEFKDNGGFPHQLYVREARRMLGDYIMTQANCEGKESVKDGVGMAAYNMDSHNTQRLVVNGMVKNEGNVEIPLPGPYPISYRCILPKKRECSNLIVPVCLSATHIAYGSIRMEPVFMVLAQSSAVAASMAIKEGKDLIDLDVAKIQAELLRNPLADNSTPEILADDAYTRDVEMSGGWNKKNDIGKKYGSSYLEATKGDEDAWVRFKPAVKKTGKYRVYWYVSGVGKWMSTGDLASNLQLEITHKGGSYNTVINCPKNADEWVDLGEFEFNPGEAVVKAVSNNSKGLVRADAVLLVPVENFNRAF